MIQRKQTVFIIFALMLMLSCVMFPLAKISAGEITEIDSLDFTNGKSLDWFQFLYIGAGVLSSFISFITIFLYKKRKIQVKFCNVNMLIMIAFYAVFAYHIFSLSSLPNFHFLKPQFGLIAPFVAIVFTILAKRSIKADEKLVRSLNRLRD